MDVVFFYYYYLLLLLLFSGLYSIGCKYIVKVSSFNCMAFLKLCFLVFSYEALIAVVNLTLIDLPGLTKVAVGKLGFLNFFLQVIWVLYFFWFESSYELFMIDDWISKLHMNSHMTENIHSLWYVDGQSESIVQDIENMVRSFIEKVIVRVYNIVLLKIFPEKFFVFVFQLLVWK